MAEASVDFVYVGTAFPQLPKDPGEAAIARRHKLKPQDMPVSTRLHVGERARDIHPRIYTHTYLRSLCKVTDAQGRRRFHGAFTGGFSAGYFNTVGTKEGWAPATFKSSRAAKRDDKGASKTGRRGAGVICGLSCRCLLIPC